MNSDVARILIANPRSVKQVVEVLNSSGLGLALVVDHFGVLVGTVSDGDVRRALLDGHGLDSNPETVINRNFVSASEDVSSRDLDERARLMGISVIPIVNGRNQIVGLHSLRGDSRTKGEVKPHRVVIMAGGLGTRLRPLTDSTPKPMLLVAGKPMLLRIIENLREEGFRSIAISINYLGEQISEYFGDGAHFGVSISYLKEGEPLGTAGALSLLEQDTSTPVVVMNGDILMTANVGDMIRYHQECEAEITVGAKAIETQIPFGVLTTDGARITRIEEKPTYVDLVNAGIYVLNASLVAMIPREKRLDMPEFIQGHLENSRVFVFPIHEKWMDLGHPDDLREAAQHYPPERST